MRRCFLLACIFLALPSVACGGSAEPAAAPEPAPVAAPRVQKERAWLDPLHVVIAMRGEEKRYRKCFMRAMQDRGVVQTRFDVDADGAVERIQVDRNTLGREDVAECLTTQLKEQVFKATGAPAQGRWTFVFRLIDPIEPKKLAQKLKKERKLAKDGGVRIEPSSTGTMAASDIEETTLAGMQLFARCYRDAIQRREQPTGILRFRLVIDEQGHLRELDDAGTLLPDPFAVDCIAEGFYAMDFPKPEGGSVEAHYRLDFE